MVKSTQWRHTKVNLETNSRSERRKALKELGKQEDKFNQIIDKLRQNVRKETDKDSNGNA
jgi:hypothetical protein